MRQEVHRLGGYATVQDCRIELHEERVVVEVVAQIEEGTELGCNPVLVPLGQVLLQLVLGQPQVVWLDVESVPFFAD